MTAEERRTVARWLEHEARAHLRAYGSEPRVALNTACSNWLADSLSWQRATRMKQADEVYRDVLEVLES